MGKLTHCSGVILAGGLNTRFSGQSKAMLKVGGRPILDWIYAAYRQLFDQILLVTNTPYLYMDWDLTIVTDIFPHRSSLTGIHTGLFYSAHPHAFFTACDTPFINPLLIRALVERIDSHCDVIFPSTRDGLEPLFAVYAAKSLPRIEDRLQKKHFKIQRVFRKDRIKTIPENTLRRIDPDLHSFFNINTPEDLGRAQRMLNNLVNPIEKRPTKPETKQP